jgi:uncharacterized short protein YbdD (DUF466 family)
MKKFWKFSLLLRDHLSGDFAYQNYLEHHSKKHKKEKPLSKKLFLRDKEKCKWNKINRCC